MQVVDVQRGTGIAMRGSGRGRRDGDDAKADQYSTKVSSSLSIVQNQRPTADWLFRDSVFMAAPPQAR